jgi:phosphatidylcholine synthase
VTTNPIEPAPARKPFSERLPAYLVHFFTASGGALAFLALFEAIDQHFAMAFGWLGIALIVDGIDGTIARALHVRDRVPNLSGDVLDLVIDFTTYVFVPAAILVFSGFWPRPLALGLGVVIIVSAALYFADLRMKTPDNWFAGFPAVWNVIVFYLVVFKPNAWVAMLVIAIAAVGQATPFVFVHPFRVRQFKPLTLGMCVVWSIAGFVAISENLDPDLLTRIVLLGCAVYFGGLGILRRRPPAKDLA